MLKKRGANRKKKTLNKPPTSYSSLYGNTDQAVSILIAYPVALVPGQASRMLFSHCPTNRWVLSTRTLKKKTLQQKQPTKTNKQRTKQGKKPNQAKTLQNCDLIPIFSPGFPENSYSREAVADSCLCSCLLLLNSFIQ